jgi:nucleotide-binding universal stress UspA family protein
MLLGWAGETEAYRANPHWLRWIRGAAAKAVTELARKGLKATAITTDGEPQRVLLDDAERWKADRIFLGAHGLSRLDRFLLGSVSTSVAERAHCAVEVVRGA